MVSLKTFAQATDICGYFNWLLLKGKKQNSRLGINECKVIDYFGSSSTGAGFKKFLFTYLLKTSDKSYIKCLGKNNGCKETI